VEINRNQYFLAGLVIFMLGLQLRYVDSFVLNEKCSRFVAKRFDSPRAAAAPSFETFLTATPSPSPVGRTIRPPKWLGFALLSVGGVLILHSLAMKRPD
jgi:hypothetical protein